MNPGSRGGETSDLYLSGGGRLISGLLGECRGREEGKSVGSGQWGCKEGPSE